MGTALATVILIVVFEVFVAGRRNTSVLNRSLEANEAVLQTFRSLTRDIRSSREVVLPELSASDADPPEFSWNSPDQGVHRLDLQIFDLVLDGGKLVPKTKRVVWYLDDPVVPKKGGDPTYSLYRAEQDYQDAADPDDSGGPVGPGGIGALTGLKAPKKVAERVRELVFFRKEEEQGEPQPGAGPRNVQVKMISSRIRKTRDGRRLPGYTAELRTTVHIRGGK